MMAEKTFVLTEFINRLVTNLEGRHPTNYFIDISADTAKAVKQRVNAPINIWPTTDLLETETAIIHKQTKRKGVLILVWATRDEERLALLKQRFRFPVADVQAAVELSVRGIRGPSAFYTYWLQVTNSNITILKRYDLIA